jgi:DNA-binding MarR family transcriptional regulator
MEESLESMTPEGDQDERVERQVAELIAHLMRVTHAMQFSEGLNPVQWEAMRYVARANRRSSTPGNLADFLGTTKGTVSQTLISLESKGYLQRTRWSGDRRVVRLHLTDQGIEMLKKDPLLSIVEALSKMPGGSVVSLYRKLSGVLRFLKESCGYREFGYCGRCGHYLVEKGGEKIEIASHCGLMGRQLDEGDKDRICANFRSLPPDTPPDTPT